MTARGSAALYSTDILALALSLAEYPLRDDLPLRGSAHSRLCGSRIELAFDVAENGAIKGIGAQVTACAIGQAAAALFLRAAPGRAAQGLPDALSEIESWLEGGALPSWPGIDMLSSARDYPARHGAITLPWKAALDALSKIGPRD